MPASPTAPTASVPPVTDAPSPAMSWRDSLTVYLEPATLRMLALGFSAGLPLLLVLGTLSFRLREAGVARTDIGYLSWVGLVYAFKWVWAPLVDRLPIPLLTRAMGRRRSWLLLAQALVIGGLVGTPLVAVPTSVGYGASLGGVAALLTMLNSCAAGTVVVNIDNGFGAGVHAARVARNCVR